MADETPEVKYYAVAGSVSTEHLDGGIQITEEQYLAAIEGMLEGKEITIVDGALVIDFPPEPEQPEPEPEDPSAPYSILKTLPWDRMTDPEADLVYAKLQTKGAKFKGTYDAAVVLTSNTQLFADVRQLFIDATLTPARANELLAKPVLVATEEAAE